MNITMVGTGSFASNHNSACVLIDEKILVDIPNGSVKQMKKMGYTVLDIETVAITHFHGDHYFDIPFLLLERRIFGKDKQPLNIICPEYGVIKIKQLLELAFEGFFEHLDELVNFIPYNDEIKVLDIKGYEIDSVKVSHGEDIAYGYYIKKDNISAGVSGDTSFCEAVENLVAKSDVTICELSFVKGSIEHMGIDKMKELTDKFPSKKIIATHMSENVREIVLNSDKMGLLEVVEDGYKFNIYKNI